MSASYIFRLDDIAPTMNWERYAKLRDIFARYDVRPLIAVIPQNEDPEFLKYEKIPVDFWQEVRDRRDDGWHIAQHGYRHRYDTPYPGILGVSKRSEFAGHPYDEQLARVRAGKEVLEQQGLKITTFVAPSHSFDGNTLRALKEVGITTVSDGFAFYPYFRDGLLFVPQLTETPRPIPFGVHTFCLHTNSMSDALFGVVERFLEAHHAKVIPFEKAGSLVNEGAANALSGVLARYALKAKRALAPTSDY